MKIGFLTACLPEAPLEDIVPWAAEQGFKALELAAWPFDSDRDYKARQIDAAHFTNEDAEKCKNLFAKHNLKISALAYYDNNVHPDPAKRKHCQDHLKKVIQTAEKLDVELVGTFVGSQPDLSPAENIRKIGAVFNELVQFAADHNVKLMIENCPMINWLKFGMPGNYAYSPELWDALFNEVSSDNFGLNIDPSHLYWLGIDYIQAVYDFAPKIFHAHAKDTEMLDSGAYKFGILGQQLNPEQWQSGWWRYRMPGWGEINWQLFISALQENGYDEVLSIEHEDPLWEGSNEKVLGGLQLGYRHLAQFVIP